MKEFILKFIDDKIEQIQIFIRTDSLDIKPNIERIKDLNERLDSLIKYKIEFLELFNNPKEDEK